MDENITFSLTHYYGNLISSRSETKLLVHLAAQPEKIRLQQQQKAVNVNVREDGDV